MAIQALLFQVTQVPLLQAIPTLVRATLQAILAPPVLATLPKDTHQGTRVSQMVTWDPLMAIQAPVQVVTLLKDTLVLQVDILQIRMVIKRAILLHQTVTLRSKAMVQVTRQAQVDQAMVMLENHIHLQVLPPMGRVVRLFRNQTVAVILPPRLHRVVILAILSVVMTIHHLTTVHHRELIQALHIVILVNQIHIVKTLRAIPIHILPLKRLIPQQMVGITKGVREGKVTTKTVILQIMVTQVKMDSKVHTMEITRTITHIIVKTIMDITRILTKIPITDTAVSSLRATMICHLRRLSMTCLKTRIVTSH